MTGLFQRLHRLRPSRPRHPLLRIGFALLGLALVVLLVAGSVFIGLGMLAWRLAHKLRRPPAPADGPAGRRAGLLGVMARQHTTQRELFGSRPQWDEDDARHGTIARDELPGDARRRCFVAAGGHQRQARQSRCPVHRR